MNIRFTLTTIAICFLMVLPLSAKTKIACVGNSITFGYGIANRETNSYPAQLQALLGDEYEVQNFGISGATIFSYVKNKKNNRYQASIDFNPDIVIIKLGTNDSKQAYTEQFNDFETNYKSLIKSYQDLPSSPRIILVTPVRCYRTDEAAIYDPRIVKQIIPAIERVAYDTRVEIIDGHSIFEEEVDEALMPDHLHPSAAGAKIMVDLFARHLNTDRDEEFDLLSKIEAKGKGFNYHGYEGREFVMDGLSVKVVKPKVANENHSWIMRARFWGNAPQFEMRMLELGYHLVYCDQTHQFGSPTAMKNWDTLYKYLTKLGLNQKMVLEGYSRGGLFIYNWAAAYPKRVSALYADAPVIDPKSWPMACGESEGSEAMTEKMIEAYGVSSREELMKYKNTPLNNAKIIAKSGIPILHVIGTDDKIVPVAENTALMAEALRSYGGEIEIIEKDGIGHHPHSLAVPEPIVEFVLKAEGL